MDLSFLHDFTTGALLGAAVMALCSAWRFDRLTAQCDALRDERDDLRDDLRDLRERLRDIASIADEEGCS